MNLHHLELFHAVVLRGSVSAAATRLGVSQPSVSRQIRELEERMGIELLERLPRGVKPTEAGEILFSHAIHLFAVRDRARQALRERVELTAGVLTVGASSTVGTHLLPHLLAEFRRSHPGPELRFELGNTAEVEELLRSGGIEVGLVEGGASSEFEKGTFGGDELVPVAAAGYFPAGKRPRTFAAFCENPLILRESGAGSRSLLESAFTSRTIRPRVLASLASAEAIARFVEAGLGISLLPKSVVSEHLSRGTLAEIPLRDVSFDLRFDWIRVRGRPVSPAAQGFIRCIEGRADRKGRGGAPQVRSKPAVRK